jgi:hypothetical protein
VHNPLEDPQQSREPWKQFVWGKLKAWGDIRTFLRQTRKILSDPMRALTLTDREGTKWLSPLTYAVVGCGLIFLMVTIVELAIVHTATPAAEEILLAAEKSAAAGDAESQRHLEYARSRAATWRKDALSDRQLIGNLLKLEFPLALLFGSYVFRYLIRDEDTHERMAPAHNYHLQYIFAIFFLPNLAYSLVMQIQLLDQHYVLPDSLIVVTETAHIIVFILSIALTWIATTNIKNNFYVPRLRAWLALVFANVVGAGLSYAGLRAAGALTSLIFQSGFDDA